MTVESGNQTVSVADYQKNKLSPRTVAILEKLAQVKSKLDPSVCKHCEVCYAKLGPNHLGGSPDHMFPSVCKGFTTDGHPVEGTACMLTSEK